MKRTHAKSSREGKEAPSVSFQSAVGEMRDVELSPGFTVRTPFAHPADAVTIVNFANRWQTPHGRARTRKTLAEALTLFGGTIAAVVTE